MRLGIMLRHFDQHGGGVKVYTHQLLESLLRLNPRHEIVLLFREPSSARHYKGYPRVTSVALPAASVFQWDQLAVPRAVARHRIDFLLNLKYSIPLRVRARTAWVCHGLDWYVMPQASKWLDRLSHRFLVPRYAARADAIFAVSEVTRRHVMEFLPVAPERVHTVYSGVSDAFRRPVSDGDLAAARREYRLPARYVLYSGAIYPPKNFRRLVQAYARVGPARGVSLVIAGGTNRFLSADELKEPERLGLQQWVHWVGWVPHERLPALYRQAEALLLPSLFESFGLPMLEAMACGCPVLTANRYGTKELGEGAALLVDPESVDAIAAGLARLLSEPDLRATLVASGRNRARRHTWDRCASQMLAVLDRLDPRHDAVDSATGPAAPPPLNSLPAGPLAPPAG